MSSDQWEIFLKEGVIPINGGEVVKNLLPFERFERDAIVKKEAETNSSYGCYPEERNTEELVNFGIINIDKPSGPSSHQVSAYVKQVLHLKKAGHSGTLE